MSFEEKKTSKKKEFPQKLPLVEKKSIAFEIFKNTKEGYVLMDTAGNIRQMNPKAKEILGFDNSKEKVNAQKMIYKKDFAYAMKSFTTLLKKGEFKNYNARVTTKSGAIKRIHIDTQVIYNEYQKPIGAHGIIREVKDNSYNHPKGFDNPPHIGAAE